MHRGGLLGKHNENDEYYASATRAPTDQDHTPFLLSYGPGRHSLLFKYALNVDGTEAEPTFVVKDGTVTSTILAELNIAHGLVADAFIAKFKWTPWPDSIPRMLNTNSLYRDVTGGFEYYSVYVSEEITTNIASLPSYDGKEPRLVVTDHNHQV
jgi:hypothetical protein